ncbi:hypothetical protein EYF80_033363 [Liparis tanakae]|uniref:Uncharacterized protein n=1 Tax=Liparis tanakae TaxID=230148 RepID=A0A4Z2GUI2_9TELE|nr:hypothetical protein EYF80_033363 [Liparis tanakae]
MATCETTGLTILATGVSLYGTTSIGSSTGSAHWCFHECTTLKLHRGLPGEVGGPSVPGPRARRGGERRPGLESAQRPLLALSQPAMQGPGSSRRGWAAAGRPDRQPAASSAVELWDSGRGLGRLALPRQIC